MLIQTVQFTIIFLEKGYTRLIIEARVITIIFKI